MNRVKTLKGAVNLALVVVIAILVTFTAFLFVYVQDKNKNAIDFAKYDVNSYIEANDENGQIADHIIGSKNAKVILYEYADYQCSGCATAFPRVEAVLDEYEETEVALVYRSYQLSYHQNTKAASSAAEAAGLQGYWKEYAEILFSNQDSWFYASGAERTELFEGFFTTVTDGKGDMDKFRKDISSKEVKAKVDFDLGISNRVDITGTPTYYINGEKIDFTSATTEASFKQIFRDYINKALGK